MKDELSDTEGLRYKLEDRQKDILELKKALRMKVRHSYTHINMPIMEVYLLYTYLYHTHYSYPYHTCTHTHTIHVLIPIPYMYSYPYHYSPKYHTYMLTYMCLASLSLQVQELGESSLKIGILEKKFENVEGECLKRIEAERAEALKYQAAMETEKKSVLGRVWASWGRHTHSNCCLPTLVSTTTQLSSSKRRWRPLRGTMQYYRSPWKSSS